MNKLKTLPQPSCCCCAKKKFDWKYWVPRIVCFIAFGVIGFLIYVYRQVCQVMLEIVFTWVQENKVAGPFVISFSTALTVIVMGPYSLFGIATGYTLKKSYENTALELAIGTLAVFSGAWIGAVVAFFFGRYLCRKAVKGCTEKNRVLKAIDATMENNGAKLIFVMRLSMLVPFNFSNYVFGGSAVKPTQFMLGTLGLVPMALFFVYIGTTMATIEEAVSNNHGMSTLEIVIMVVGSSFALGGIIFASISVKRTLNKEMARQNSIRDAVIAEREAEIAAAEAELAAQRPAPSSDQEQHNCGNTAMNRILPVSEAQANIPSETMTSEIRLRMSQISYIVNADELVPTLLESGKKDSEVGTSPFSVEDKTPDQLIAKENEESNESGREIDHVEISQFKVEENPPQAPSEDIESIGNHLAVLSARGISRAQSDEMLVGKAQSRVTKVDNFFVDDNSSQDLSQ